MSVNPVSGGNVIASQAQDIQKTGLDLGYEAFVKLLLAQLKNQDPTKPMDATEYVSQLATLSQLEQTMKQSKQLDELLVRSSYSQAVSVIGMRLTDRAEGVSGIVQLVEIRSEGAWAKLEDGTSVRIGGGVVLSKQ